MHCGGPLDFSKDVTANLKAIIEVNVLAEDVAKRLFVDQLAEWQSGTNSLYGAETADSIKPILTKNLQGSQEWLKKRLANIYEDAKSFACGKLVVFKMEMDPGSFFTDLQGAEQLQQIAAIQHQDDVFSMICNMAQQTGPSPNDTVILRANSWLNKARIECAKMSQLPLPQTPSDDVDNFDGISISTTHLKQLETMKETFGGLSEFVESHKTQLDMQTVVKVRVVDSDPKELDGADVKEATEQGKEVCEQQFLKVAAAWHALCVWSKGFLQKTVPDVQPHLQEPKEEVIKEKIFNNTHRAYISTYHSKISRICKQFKDMDQRLKLSPLITNFPKLLDDLTTELNRVKFVTLVTLGQLLFFVIIHHRIYSTTQKTKRLDNANCSTT